MYFNRAMTAHVAEILLLAELAEDRAPHRHLSGAMLLDSVGALDAHLHREGGKLTAVLPGELGKVVWVFFQCVGGRAIALRRDAMADRTVFAEKIDAFQRMVHVRRNFLDHFLLRGSGNVAADTQEREYQILRY